MAKASVVYRETRFVFEGPDGNGPMHVFVFCEAHGDCPLGVQGWHYKMFTVKQCPSAKHFFELWARGAEDPVLWPQKAPDEEEN